MGRYAGAGTPRWEHFTHGADIGVRGIAETVEGAFEQAAIALTAVVIDPVEVQARETFEFECEAPDLEMLLVDWLNLLVYEMATSGVLFREFDLELRGCHLRATARGERIDPARHELAVEVKGATYTALSVRQEVSGLWVAECVVDV